MKNKIVLKISSSLIVDAAAILFIFYLGEISSFIGFPLYSLDPMRMMVILAIAFTPRWNTYLLPILLPIVSYYFGAHPHLMKSSLMIIELLINVSLFWFLLSKTRMTLLSILLSILFSKAVYYTLKYISLQQDWMSGEMISTPFDLQVITTLAMSVFLLLAFLFIGKPGRN
jgi:hypothetical protein